MVHPKGMIVSITLIIHFIFTCFHSSCKSELSQWHHYHFIHLGGSPFGYLWMGLCSAPWSRWQSLFIINLNLLSCSRTCVVHVGRSFTVVTIHASSHPYHSIHVCMKCTIMYIMLGNTNLPYQFRLCFYSYNHNLYMKEGSYNWTMFYKIC